MVLGIPLANVFENSIKAKKSYLSEMRKKNTGKAKKNKQAKSVIESIKFNDWYNHKALTQVNQAIGRVKRNEDDFGAIILLDDRYVSDNGYAKYLSPLHLQIESTFGTLLDLQKELFHFFNQNNDQFLQKKLKGGIQFTDANIKAKIQEKKFADNGEFPKQVKAKNVKSKINALQSFMFASQSSSDARQLGMKKSESREPSFIESDEDSVNQCLQNNRKVAKTIPIENQIEKEKSQSHVVLSSEKARIEDWIHNHDQRKLKTADKGAFDKPSNNKITSFFMSSNTQSSNKPKLENSKSRGGGIHARYFKRSNNNFKEQLIMKKSNNASLLEKVKAKFGSECPICCDEIDQENLSQMRISRCNHLACQYCWDHSLKQKLECMACRTRTRSKLLQTVSEYFGNK